MDVIGAIHVVARRVPLIEVDAAEIDHPHQRGGILNHREVDDPFRSVIDRADFDPVGARRRRTFHEEELAGRAVRIALHHHRAIVDVREQYIRDIGVVLNEIAFRDAEGGPERLAQVRQPDFFSLDGQDDVVLVARNRQARAAHRIGGSFGGLAPWRTAPMTGPYGSSTPSRAWRSSNPPRLMSPRPTKSTGNRSRSPKMLVRMSTYFGDATLP